MLATPHRKLRNVARGVLAEKFVGRMVRTATPQWMGAQRLRVLLHVLLLLPVLSSEVAAGPSAEAVALCVRWAVAGECVANTAFMREQCTEQCTCDARAAQGECSQLAATASELDLSDFDRRCTQALKLQGCQEQAARAAELLQRQRLRQQQRQQQLLQAAQCDGWAEAGECERNPEWMLSSCGAACADLPPPSKAECERWAASGECEHNSVYMLGAMRGGGDGGSGGSGSGGGGGGGGGREGQCVAACEAARLRPSCTIEICRGAVVACVRFNHSAAAPAAQKQQPQRQVTECDGWAEAGECERNPEWMLSSCPKECADRDPPLPPCPPPRRRGRAAPPPPPCGTAAPPWRSGLQLGASFSFRNEAGERVELLWVDDATDLEVQSATLQPHAPEATTPRTQAATPCTQAATPCIPGAILLATALRTHRDRLLPRPPLARAHRRARRRAHRRARGLGPACDWQGGAAGAAVARPLPSRHTCTLVWLRAVRTRPHALLAAHRGSELRAQRTHAVWNYTRTRSCSTLS